MGTLRLFLRAETCVSDNSTDIVRGDLLSFEDCMRFVQGLDVVIHLAHCNAPVNCDLDQPKDALLNIIPLLNLLRAVEITKSKPHVVYFSSGGAIYGRTRDHVPFRETDPCEPFSSYGIQKLVAEHYLRLAAQNGHLTCTVLRVGNAYGTVLPHERMQGLIGTAVNRVIRGMPVRVFGRMDNVRDYVHLDDICRIVEVVVHSKTPFTIVNIGGGRGFSVSEVLQNIQDCVNYPLEVQAVLDPECGRRLSDWVVLDITKARTEFVWTPTVDFRAGIRAMVAGLQTRVPLASATGSSS
jgi:UDP-glucose 4-epimerase